MAILNTGAEKKSKRGRKPSIIPRSETEQGKFILSKAVELFAKNGYSNSTMDDLCASTGLNKATLYYYYRSKSDLLFCIADSTISSALESTKGIDITSPSKALAELIERQVNWMQKNPEPPRVWIQESQFIPMILNKSQTKILREKRVRFTAVLTEVLDNGMSSGAFRKMDSAIIARSILATLNASLYWSPRNQTRQEIVDTVVDVFMHGVASNSEP